MATDPPPDLKQPSAAADTAVRRVGLEEAATQYQRAAIIPHCPTCTRPCCALDELVLELDWPQTRALYQIRTSRSQFDRAVHEGEGPPDIKESHGRYYAHGKPCRAFDVETHHCRVYGTDAKPEGCSEFPVYRDGRVITADRRCEAVDVDALHAHLERATGLTLERNVDAQFSFFVSFEPKRAPAAPTETGPRRGKLRTRRRRGPAGA